MRIVFCADPLDHSQPDEMFFREAEAAENAGFQIGLINYECLVYSDDVETALAELPMLSTPETVLYRGGLLKPHHYTTLYEALYEKGWQLINMPSHYLHCHYLPESYSVITNHTPRTMWLECGVEVPMGEVKNLLQFFGMKPVLVRDYGHSQKLYNATTSYIPLASDAEAVERVVKQFVETVDDTIEGGLIFREFAELDTFGTDPRTGMPMGVEYRTFWLDGTPIFAVPYWKSGNYENKHLPISEFKGIAAEIRSRFFTMDLARRSDGEWIILELDDAQVSHLPDHANMLSFYQALAG